jgi:hypothetical protein
LRATGLAFERSRRDGGAESGQESQAAPPIAGRFAIRLDAGPGIMRFDDRLILLI